MSKRRINGSRVIFSGILAGIILMIGEFILNTRILAGQWRIVFGNMNLALPDFRVHLAAMVIVLFLGLLLMWLYAAIRPRIGRGIRSAVYTGLVVWLLYYLMPFSIRLIFGFLPVKPVLYSVSWGLFEILAAVCAGAWLYNHLKVEKDRKTGKAKLRLELRSFKV